MNITKSARLPARLPDRYYEFNIIRFPSLVSIPRESVEDRLLKFISLKLKISQSEIQEVISKQLKEIDR